MQRRFAITVLLIALAMAAPGAQTPAEKPKPTPSVASETFGQPVNVKLELTIADRAGQGEPIRKVVTLIVADRANGSIRSLGTVRSQGRVQINVDARPQILQSGAIRVMLGLEYNPRSLGNDAPAEWSSLTQQLGVVLQPGKPLLVSQAADPASDRQITVEVTATPLK